MSITLGKLLLGEVDGSLWFPHAAGGTPSPVGFSLTDFFAAGDPNSSGSATFNVPAHDAGDGIIVMLSTAFNTLTLPNTDTAARFAALSVGDPPSTAQLTQSATCARLYGAIDPTGTTSTTVTFDWAAGNSPWMVCGFIVKGASFDIANNVGNSKTQVTNGGMDLTVATSVANSSVAAFAARRTSGDHTLIGTFTREAGQDNGGTNGEAEVASANGNPFATTATDVQCTWSSPFSNNIFYLVELVPA